MKKNIQFSKVHRDYLKKYRTKKLLIFLTQITILIAIFVGWELLTILPKSELKRIDLSLIEKYYPKVGE